MSMNQVWVVHKGCKYEGGSAKAVCATRDVAIRFARYLAKRYAYRHVTRRKRSDGTREAYNGFFRRVKGTDRWESYSDLILVYPERVY